MAKYGFNNKITYMANIGFTSLWISERSSCAIYNEHYSQGQNISLANIEHISLSL